ncbi:uncharacterized protein LOC142353738 [Convolutriloba macropyga]|uniref:uncharacterized protein LOC142353738 n=1 Tax=Convolutriloba macropyga TaxID=536237 RepID=UPI003F524B2A
MVNRKRYAPRGPIVPFFLPHPVLSAQRPMSELIPCSGYSLPGNFGAGKYEKVLSVSCAIPGPSSTRANVREQNEPRANNAVVMALGHLPGSSQEHHVHDIAGNVRLDKNDSVNCSNLGDCFFPWPKQLDRISDRRPWNLVIVYATETVTGAILRIGPKQKKEMASLDERTKMLFLMLNGKCILTIGDRDIFVEKGAKFCINPGHCYAIRNISERKVDFDVTVLRN